MSDLTDNSSLNRAKREVKSTLIEPFRQIKFGAYVISASVAFVLVVAVMFVLAFYEQYQHVMSLFNITDVKDQMELVTNDIFYRNAIAIGLMLVGYIKEGSAGFVTAQWEFVAAWCAFSAGFVV